MGNIVAQLFRDHPDFDDFKRRVTGLRGAFGFGYDDMIEIGEAYFDRYPDCFSNRNCGDVTLGYKLVRVCIIEKMVDPLPEGIKNSFREMLHDLSRIEAGISRMVRNGDTETVFRWHESMAAGLKDIQDTIDALPIGMIKERYIGGVSYIHNIMYLLKGAIAKAGARA